MFRCVSSSVLTLRNEITVTLKRFLQRKCSIAINYGQVLALVLPQKIIGLNLGCLRSGSSFHNKYKCRWFIWRGSGSQGAMAPSHSKESGYFPQEQLHSRGPRGGPQKHYRLRTDWDLGLGESVEFPLPPFSDVSTSLVATDPSVSLATTTGALVAPGSLIQRPVCQIQIYMRLQYIFETVCQGDLQIWVCVSLCVIYLRNQCYIQWYYLPLLYALVSLSPWPGHWLMWRRSEVNSDHCLEIVERCVENV